MDVSQLTEQNHLFMSVLMFIGASPSSAGGGIRTTTFALVIIFIVTYARGGKSIRIFRREVYEEDLLKAVTVTLMAVITVFSSLFIISIIEPYSRSEEHTSELQSRGHLVCRLLLEKNNKRIL